MSGSYHEGICDGCGQDYPMYEWKDSDHVVRFQNGLGTRKEVRERYCSPECFVENIDLSTTGSDQMAANAADETVAEETIAAYRVQRLENGSVRIKSGGYVVTAPTFFEALERYAKYQREHIEGLPDHLQPDKRRSIHDGYVPLESFDSSGFEPLEILEAVTHHPIEIILDDIFNELAAAYNTDSDCDV